MCIISFSFSFNLLWLNWVVSTDWPSIWREGGGRFSKKTLPVWIKNEKMTIVYIYPWTNIHELISIREGLCHMDYILKTIWIYNVSWHCLLCLFNGLDIIMHIASSCLLLLASSCFLLYCILGMLHQWDH